jgi:hypothetical protein
VSNRLTNKRTNKHKIVIQTKGGVVGLYVTRQADSDTRETWRSQSPCVTAGLLTVSALTSSRVVAV